MMIRPKPKQITSKISRRRIGPLFASLFIALVCIVVLLEDPRKYGGPVIITKMPRKLVIAEGSDLKEGQALVQSTMGKCEDEACKANGEPIPKTIWMLWDTGFENANKDAKRSYDSWIQYNPTWEVRGLNLTEAEELTKVHEEGTDGYLPDWVWHSMEIQAKSDYIRISLLRNHGGVWADASLLCNEPLDDWIDRDRDYLFFLRDEMRPDNYRKLYPWYSSWWMAASKDSHAADLIYDDVVYFLRNQGQFRREYFWFHRIVANLWHTDESFIASIGPSESAQGPHCMLGYRSFVDQHMFKRCARATEKESFNLISEQVWKEKEQAKIKKESPTAEKKQ